MNLNYSSKTFSPLPNKALTSVIYTLETVAEMKKK